MYFGKYRLLKAWLNHSLESAVSEPALYMLMGGNHSWNLHESTFISIFLSLWTEMTWKMSPLLNFEIMGVFVNTMIADENYPFGDCGNLHFPIQIQFS